MMRGFLLTLALTVACGVAGSMLVRELVAVSAPSAQASVSEQESYWRERIKVKGGVSAYRELSRSIAAWTPETQHTAAHAFGGMLYEVEGSRGLAVCDSNFSFGCYHEFLGKAIGAQGLASVPTLNQGCVDALGPQSLSCQHGIGHGIVAHVGYLPQSLVTSLEECARLPYSDPIGGCYGGVFMEYNMQTMLGTDARPRPLGDNPYAPCDRLEPQYVPACYFWQPQWWIQALMPQRGEASFAQAGKWCETLAAHARYCFEGLGNVAPAEAGFSPEGTRSLCESVSANLRHELYCKSFAANSLGVGGAGKRGDGEAVCTGLEGKEAAYCLAYARNEANILQARDLP